MIGYVQGEILEHLDGKMLIGVGDRQSTGTGRIGYAVSVPQSPSYGAFLMGQTIELFVHTHVREDALDLYGFSSQFEKSLFLTLLTVNGIGPKSALGILSAVEASQLVEAIMEGDKDFLTQIPGIGKKTAERVVVELKDSVRKKMEAGGFGRGLSSQPVLPPKGATVSGSTMLRDAKSALVGLGYREQEIHPLLEKALKTETDLGGPPKKVEDLIRTVLRQLA